MRSDAIIIGGSFAGLSTAMYIAQRRCVLSGLAVIVPSVRKQGPNSGLFGFAYSFINSQTSISQWSSRVSMICFPLCGRQITPAILRHATQ